MQGFEKTGKFRTKWAIRRVLYTAKRSSPTMALGEDASQEPFGHLGSHFAEQIFFADHGTRRTRTK
jgi:hypothetical protein